MQLPTEPYPSGDGAAIEVRSLGKTYPGGVEAVKSITFDVNPGEVFGLLGPNGAGKSTTIGMLTTTVTPTSGSARVGGFDVSTDPLAARSVSSVVFQDSVVDATLTGRRNLDIHARLWNVPAGLVTSRVAEMSTLLGVAHLLDRPVASYSGGERRRLEISRALVSQPQILIMDEPTVGLDPRIRFELLDIIASLRARGEMTILLTTHYLDEAERLCDRLAIMHEGRIVALDSPRALLDGMGREIVELRVDGDASRAQTALRSRGIAGHDSFVVGSTVTIPLHERTSAQTVASINGIGLGVAAISTRPPSLDDVYLRLTGGRIAAAA